jgi:hypothetical protein
MTKAFMPLNRRMVEVVISNADLIEGDMSQSLLDLVAHVVSYEVILARWELSDFKEHVPKVVLPAGVEIVVQTEYRRLREVQQQLLASRSAIN